MSLRWLLCSRQGGNGCGTGQIALKSHTISNILSSSSSTVLVFVIAKKIIHTKRMFGYLPTLIMNQNSTFRRMHSLLAFTYFLSPFLLHS
ncbi:hypothetical protein EYC84_007572 [Monilinia fructicola]|uniref:Uncharacterized protein n=1 Tax=Monilinia fructicola TaxID=38448 RepID=A0A5M9JL60_MONFR|nr:hypothetical protein EYC84_007572 [Monilinia fructicola]